MGVGGHRGPETAPARGEGRPVEGGPAVGIRAQRVEKLSTQGGAYGGAGAGMGRGGHPGVCGMGDNRGRLVPCLYMTQLGNMLGIKETRLSCPRRQLQV